MPLPGQFHFAQHNQSNIALGPIQDGQPPNDVITDATITVSLWSLIKGLKHQCYATTTLTMGLDQVHRGTLGDDNFNPPVGSDYMTMIDLVTTSGPGGHWEVPTTVLVRTL